MIRQIIIPTQNSYTINLPNEMIGKEVEVIAFEINTTTKSYAKSINNEDVFFDTEVDLSKFKFNRDEANDYERD